MPLIQNHSDVLANHVKGCASGALNHDSCSSVHEPKRRRRVKRACDKCAALKVKCDYGTPCGRCHGRGSLCEYKRETDPDLRLIYNVGQGLPSDEQLTLRGQPSGSGSLQSKNHLPNSDLQHTDDIFNMGLENSLAAIDGIGPSLDDFSISVADSRLPAPWKDWTITTFDRGHDTLLPHMTLSHDYRTDINYGTDFEIALDGFSWNPQMLQNIEDPSSDLQPTIASLPIASKSYHKGCLWLKVKFPLPVG